MANEALCDPTNDVTNSKGGLEKGRLRTVVVAGKERKLTLIVERLGEGVDVIGAGTPPVILPC